MKQPRPLALRIYLRVFAAIVFIAAIALFYVGQVEGGTACVGLTGTLLAYVAKGPGHRDNL